VRTMMVAVGFIVALTACEKRRPAEVREFPNGFRGWAVVVWSEPGHPALPTEGRKLLLRFPPDGVLITSTHQQFGWASDDFYFRDHAGRRSGPVPNAPGSASDGSIMRRGRTMHYSTYFIGTESEFQAAAHREVKLNEVFNRLHPSA
jgi:hypothetical protein